MQSMFARLCRALIAALVLILLPVSASAQQTVFDPVAGQAPVVAVGLGTQVVVYRYAAHDGTWEELWSSVPTGRFFYENADTHWQLAFGDLDSDGGDELVTVDQWALNVWGDRGTTPVRAVLSPVPETHASVAVADADGDGRKEILVGWRNILSVWRYEKGSLRQVANLEMGPTRMEMIWNINVADLDGDGERDILLGGTLLVGHQDVLRIAHFDGTRLVYGDVIPVTGAADVTRLYDWDRDGLPEIFTSGNGQRVQGIGWDPDLLAYSRFWLSSDLNGYVQGIAIGDLDADGHLDLVAGTYDYPGIHDNVPELIFFEEKGGLPVMQARVNCDQVGFPGLLIADLYGDGRQEVLLNGSKVYTAQLASDGSTVFGQTDQIKRVAQRPGEVQPNAAVTAYFQPAGQPDDSPAILVHELSIEAGGVGNELGIGRPVLLTFEGENVGGEATEVLFRLASDDPRITIPEATVRFSFVNEETHLDNRAKPFRVLVKPGVAPGPVTLRVEVSADGGYRTVRQFVEFELAELDSLGGGGR